MIDRVLKKGVENVLEINRVEASSKDKEEILKLHSLNMLRLRCEIAELHCEEVKAMQKYFIKHNLAFEYKRDIGYLSETKIKSVLDKIKEIEQTE